MFFLSSSNNNDPFLASKAVIPNQGVAAHKNAVKRCQGWWQKSNICPFQAFTRKWCHAQIVIFGMLDCSQIFKVLELERLKDTAHFPENSTFIFLLETQTKLYFRKSRLWFTNASILKCWKNFDGIFQIYFYIWT